MEHLLHPWHYAPLFAAAPCLLVSIRIVWLRLRDWLPTTAGATRPPSAAGSPLAGM